MTTPLHVLIIEDSLPDAELLLRELRRGDYEPSYARVDTEAGLQSALAQRQWDLILCDYTLLGFSGTQALSIVREMGIDVPLIFVSGTIGEDKAVTAMRAGAQDYVLKDNLKRLLPAIDRELREAALRREAAVATARRTVAETRFRVLLDMAPDAIVTVDADGMVGIYNRAAEALFGYAPDEIAGQPFRRLLASDRADDADVAPDGIPGSIPGKTRDLGSDGPRGGQTLMHGVRKDGREVPVEISFGEIIEDGATVQMAVIRDVTQRRELEEQLRQSQKMEVVGQLTGGLAHDFNNLLTVIVGNLEAIQQGLEDGSRSRRMADLALAASLRSATLTRQMLAFSRRQPLETRAFDLNELVGSTIGLLRRTLGDHISIDMDPGEGLWTAFADPAQVETALLNLALNARDAMPDGGRLGIATANVHLDAAYVAEVPDAVPGDHLVLSVTDSGSGIAPDVLARVFEPFFTTKEPGLGTGLGLSMVYGFARQSGGHVRIESAPGQGTTVRLYLPRAGDMAVANGAGAATPATIGNAQETRILVVEDDEDVRATAVALLTASGYRVTEAADGAAALTALQNGLQVDLVFTDIAMPGGMSGVDLAAAARELRPGLPVLLTTGYADIANGGPPDRDDRIRTELPVLPKPYRRAALLRMVGEVLGQNGDRDH